MPVQVGSYKLSIPNSTDGVRNVPPWDGQVVRQVVITDDPPQMEVISPDSTVTLSWEADEFTTKQALGLAVLRLSGA
jgi:hypothetical protein